MKEDDKSAAFLAVALVNGYRTRSRQWTCPPRMRSYFRLPVRSQRRVGGMETGWFHSNVAGPKMRRDRAL